MGKRKKRWLWVVEMKGNREILGEDPGWYPTIGVGLDSGEAQTPLREFRENNPDDKFRVRRYARDE